MKNLLADQSARSFSSVFAYPDAGSSQEVVPGSGAKGSSVGAAQWAGGKLPIADQWRKSIDIQSFRPQVLCLMTRAASW